MNCQFQVGGVGAERGRHRDDAPRDGGDTRQLRLVGVEHALVARIFQFGLVGLGRALLDGFARHQHLLLAIDADRAGVRRLDGFATSRADPRRNGSDECQSEVCVVTFIVAAMFRVWLICANNRTLLTAPEKLGRTPDSYGRLCSYVRGAATCAANVLRRAPRMLGPVNSVAETSLQITQTAT